MIMPTGGFFAMGLMMGWLNWIDRKFFGGTGGEQRRTLVNCGLWISDCGLKVQMFLIRNLSNPKSEMMLSGGYYVGTCINHIHSISAHQ